MKGGLHNLTPTQLRRLRELIADQLGVELDSVPEDVDELSTLGIDSLDAVEFALEIDDGPDDDDASGFPPVAVA